MSFLSGPYSSAPSPRRWQLQATSTKVCFAPFLEEAATTAFKSGGCCMNVFSAKKAELNEDRTNRANTSVCPDTQQLVSFLRGGVGECDPFFGGPLHDCARATHARRRHLPSAQHEGATEEARMFEIRSRSSSTPSGVSNLSSSKAKPSRFCRLGAHLLLRMGSGVGRFWKKVRTGPNPLLGDSRGSWPFRERNACALPHLSWYMTELVHD